MVVHNPLKVAGASSILAVVTKSCSVCAQEFTDSSPNKTRKYCNRSCASRVHNPAASKKIRGTRVCIGCGISFDYTQSQYRKKFCSRSCSARFHNLGDNSPKRQLQGRCQACGKACRASVKYCSSACRTSNRNSKLTAWMSGEDWSYKGGGVPHAVRRFLLEESEFRCSCGWDKPNPVTGEVILTINHIDGNWKNNVRSNLEVLCYNCHTLTPTFGSLNAGSPSGRRPFAGRTS